MQHEPRCLLSASQLTPTTSGHQLQNRQPSAAPQAWAQDSSESAVAAEMSLGPRSIVFSDREKMAQTSAEAVGSTKSRVDRPARASRPGVVGTWAAGSGSGGAAAGGAWVSASVPCAVHLGALTVVLGVRRQQQGDGQPDRQSGGASEPSARH